MEGKEHLVVESGRCKSSYLHSISILVLSLLLSACVATVIYMSLSTQSATCQTPAEHASVMEHQRFNLVNEDGSKMVEDVDYDESRQVSVLHQPGVFQVNDFLKGIDIVKDMETGGCYVIPVGTDRETSRALAEAMRKYKGEELRNPGNKTYYVSVIAGEIEDTSFLPREADSECSHYKWVSILGEEAADGSLVRHKRGFFSDVWKGVKDAAKAIIVREVVGLAVGAIGR